MNLALLTEVKLRCEMGVLRTPSNEDSMGQQFARYT